MAKPDSTICLGAVTVNVYDREYRLKVPRSAPVTVKSKMKFITFSTANSFLNEMLPRHLEINANMSIENSLFGTEFAISLALATDHDITVKLNRNNITLAIRKDYGTRLCVHISYDDFNADVCQLLIDTYRRINRLVPKPRENEYKPVYRYNEPHMCICYSYFAETQLLTSVDLQFNDGHPLVSDALERFILIHICDIKELDRFTEILCDITNRFSTDASDNIYFDGVLIGNTVRGTNAFTSISYEIKKRFMTAITTKSKSARS